MAAARSRLSPLKDPALAAQIGHLLLGLGRSFEAYAVSARTNTHDIPNLTVGLPQELFWQRAAGAMVHLLSSHREAGVLVLWELAERGVVPVVRDRPWARRALPDWPLLFRNAAEAVVLCEKVLDHYDLLGRAPGGPAEEHVPAGHRERRGGVGGHLEGVGDVELPVRRDEQDGAAVRREL